jgi:hypothetical protein
MVFLKAVETLLHLGVPITMAPRTIFSQFTDATLDVKKFNPASG